MRNTELQSVAPPSFGCGAKISAIFIFVAKTKINLSPSGNNYLLGIIVLFSNSFSRSISTGKMKHEFDIGYEQTFYSVRDSIPGKSYSTSYCPRLSISHSGYFSISVGIDWLQYFNSKQYFSRPVYSSRGTDTVLTGKFSKPSFMYELGPTFPIRIELQNSKYLYIIPGFMMGIGQGWDFEAKGCHDCSKKGGRIFDGFNYKLGSKFIYGRNGRGISLTINYEYPIEFKNGFIGMAGRPRPVHENGFAISIGYSFISEK